MSFRRATARSLPPSATELENRLVTEMKTPDNAPNVQPVIVAEPPAPAPISRLFVIWDDWTDLTQQDRSEIIMNAYTRAEGLPAAARISVAMGLTAAEAAKMGIG